MPEGLTSCLNSLGAKLSVVCVQVHVNRLIAGAIVTFLSLSESYWRQTLVSSPREICCCLHLNLPLWVTSEGREAIRGASRGATRGPAPPPRRGQTLGPLAP